MSLPVLHHSVYVFIVHVCLFRTHPSPPLSSSLLFLLIYANSLAVSLSCNPVLSSDLGAFGDLCGKCNQPIDMH